ncbi:hypothetical protein [Ensifer adhaerens]|uniref:hypothetical protein n=1 Tax=Ensifer adhaerens TaxID=106592 RepID=UPI00131A370C|nr:hypothetical protein [Ensifer adhaerens]
MAKNNVRDWSSTAASNTDVGGIGIEGTNAVSNFDNGLRTVMAQVAAVDEGTEPVNDTWTFADPADPTKRVRLDAGNVAAGQTRVLAMPDANVTISSFMATVLDDTTAAAARSTLDVYSRAESGILSGLRNVVINGNFDFWERATSQTSAGYGSDDRWANDHSGSTKTHSRQSFTLGQTDVPGNPAYFSRTVVTSSAGASNYVLKEHRVEGATTLSGKTVTVTFWAKADASKNIAFEVVQNFGTGGSPSASVSTPAGLKALTTAWQKFSFTVAIPSVSGKTLGSGNNDFLELVFWFDAGSSFATRASSLGQQSGTFDIARVSVVDGTATSETDPFSPRHFQQEQALCQRYYWQNASGENLIQSYAAGAGLGVSFNFRHPVVMRATPTMGTTFTSSGSIGAPSFSRIGPRTFVITATGSGAGAFTIDTSAAVTASAEL